MDILDLAKKLKPSANSVRPSQTTTVYGVATSDSTDGAVMVDMLGDSVTQDSTQAVSIPTTVAVKKGDSVRVSLVGADESAKSPTVIGVIGGGDRAQKDISTAQSTANTAQTNAAAAQTAASTAQTTADAAKTTADKTDQYFWSDTSGAHVSASGDHDISGANTLLDTNGMKLKNGTDIIASFGTHDVVLGADATNYSGIYTTMSFANCASIKVQNQTEKPPMEIGAGSINLNAYNGAILVGYGVKIYGTYQNEVTVIGPLLKTAIKTDTSDKYVEVLGEKTLFSGLTKGAITLSESAANFSRVTVFYKYDQTYSSVSVDTPDGKRAGIYLMLLQGTNLWTKTRTISISGTEITNYGQASNYAVSMNTGESVAYSVLDTPEISIYKVIGYR